MRILLSNDDGYDSPGILSLFHALEHDGYDVTVVAPSRERSTAGHSLTLHKPLRLHEMGRRIYSVSGSPADCVYLATRHIFKSPPDLVISGINRGANLGNDIFYSGTVAAAREAFLFGVPSIAISLCIGFPEKLHNDFHWETATDFISKLLRKRTETPVLRKHTLLNINVPNIPLKDLKGHRWVRQGRRIYSDEITENHDPRGRPYYWVGGGPKGYDPTPNTDCTAVAEGFLAVTPLQVDTTDDTFLRELQNLKW